MYICLWWSKYVKYGVAVKDYFIVDIVVGSGSGYGVGRGVDDEVDSDFDDKFGGLI